MRQQLRGAAALLLTALVLGACAQPAVPGGPAERPQPAPVSVESRTLVLAFGDEPGDLSPKSPTVIGRLANIIRIFNASLLMVDGSETVRPYLAEAAPELNSASWRVFPTGQMETTYVLRPGLSWHDGKPLTAEDFAFAFRVYTAPGLQMFLAAPQDRIEEVVAADTRTVVIRWRSLYPDAGTLKTG
jgi:peptide/nickel transport system substrate-binding protein